MVCGLRSKQETKLIITTFASILSCILMKYIVCMCTFSNSYWIYNLETFTKGI